MAFTTTDFDLDFAVDGSNGDDLDTIDSGWSPSAANTKVLEKAGGAYLVADSVADDGSDLAAYSQTQGGADYALEADVYFGSSGYSSYFLLGIRYNPATFSGYHVVWKGSGKWELERTAGGTPTVLGSYTDSPSAGTTRKVRVQAVGTKIKVFIDGVERINVVDATYSSAGSYFIATAFRATASVGQVLETLTAGSWVYEEQPTDGITFTDSTSESSTSNVTASCSDTLEFSENFTLVTTEVFPVETIELSETVSGYIVTAYQVSLSEGIVFSGTISLTLAAGAQDGLEIGESTLPSISLTTSDTVEFSESVPTRLSLVGNLADHLVITDAQTAFGNIPGGASDETLFTDDLESTIILRSSSADSIVWSEDLTTTLKEVFDEEVLKLSETLSPHVIYSTNLNEGLVWAETTSLVVGVYREEGVVLAEELNALIRVTTSDILELSETTTAQVMSNVTGNCSDQIQLEDTTTTTSKVDLADGMVWSEEPITITIQSSGSATDAINLSDFAGIGIPTTITDGIQLSEDFTTTIKEVFDSEGVELSDESSAGASYSIFRADSLVWSEDLQSQPIYQLADTILLGLDLSYTTAKQTSNTETLVVSDTVSNTITLIVTAADGLAFTDDHYLNVVAGIQEGLVLAEAFDLLVGTGMSESMVLSDSAAPDGYAYSLVSDRIHLGDSNQVILTTSIEDGLVWGDLPTSALLNALFDNIEFGDTTNYQYTTTPVLSDRLVLADVAKTLTDSDALAIIITMSDSKPMLQVTTITHAPVTISASSEKLYNTQTTSVVPV